MKTTGSRVMDSSTVSFAMPLTPWASKLNSAQTKDDCKALFHLHCFLFLSFGKLYLGLSLIVDINVIEELKGMGPSAVDTEIRSLSPHIGGSTHLLSQFLTAASTVLETRRSYEAVQAYLGLFLKIHCSSLGEERELCLLAERVSSTLRDSWSTLESNFESTLCLVSFFMNAVL